VVTARTPALSLRLKPPSSGTQIASSRRRLANSRVPCVHHSICYSILPTYRSLDALGLSRVGRRRWSSYLGGVLTAGTVHVRVSLFSFWAHFLVAFLAFSAAASTSSHSFAVRGRNAVMLAIVLFVASLSQITASASLSHRATSDLDPAWAYDASQFYRRASHSSTVFSVYSVGGWLKICRYCCWRLPLHRRRRDLAPR
jgi:hypothetical protein